MDDKGTYRGILKDASIMNGDGVLIEGSVHAAEGTGKDFGITYSNGFDPKNMSVGGMGIFQHVGTDFKHPNWEVKSVSSTNYGKGFAGGRTSKTGDILGPALLERYVIDKNRAYWRIP